MKDSTMNTTTDRRVRRTKKQLTESLAKLLCEKPLKNITVREISELADISRGTFYLHYRDVYDMVEQLQNEMFDRLNEIIDVCDKESPVERLNSILKAMLELLDENRELSKCLLSKNGDAVFTDRVKQQILTRCFQPIYDNRSFNPAIDFKYFSNFIISGSVGVISECLETGSLDTPDEIAALLESLIKNGASALINM